MGLRDHLGRSKSDAHRQHSSRNQIEGDSSHKLVVDPDHLESLFDRKLSEALSRHNSPLPKDDSGFVPRPDRRDLWNHSTLVALICVLLIYLLVSRHSMQDEIDRLHYETREEVERLHHENQELNRKLQLAQEENETLFESTFRNTGVLKTATEMLIAGLDEKEFLEDWEAPLINQTLANLGSESKIGVKFHQPTIPRETLQPNQPRELLPRSEEKNPVSNQPSRDWELFGLDKAEMIGLIAAIATVLGLFRGPVAYHLKVVSKLKKKIKKLEVRGDGDS